MSPANLQASATRTVSMRGLLALLCGTGSLFAYWKFYRYTEGWSGISRRSFQAIALLLVVWGTYQLLSELLPRRQARAGNAQSPPRLVGATAEGLVYLAIMCVMLIGSLLGHSNMLMLVFALMCGPFIVNGWVTYSMLRRLQAERSLPRSVMAGDVLTVNVELKNHKLWLSSWVMALTDHIANRRERLEARVLFVRVPARGERTGQYQVRLMQRGVYRFGPIHVTTRFPLGLGERGILFDHDAELIVHPRVGRVTERWRRDRLAAAELTQRRETHAGVFEDEFHRIREFRAGDNPRAIHWRTAARRNELMVREYRQSRDRDLVVLLDLWAPKRPGQVDLDRVELAVSFAATVCVDYLRCGRDANLNFIAQGDELIRWCGRAVAGGVAPILDRLAVIQPHADDGFDALLEAWRTDRTANTRTVFVTTRPRTAEGNITLQELMQAGADGTGWDAPGTVEIFAADEQELGPYFQPG